MYLDLVQDNAEVCGVAILGYCLMPNHVHWIVTPRDEDGLASAFGRAQCRYSNYFQAKRRTTGHLWQNRFYSCVLGTDHLVRAMRYVEQNAVRGGLVGRAEEYDWSSARAHVERVDPRGLLDLSAWQRIAPREEWREILQAAAEREDRLALERATYAGKAYGDAEFRRAMELRAGRELILRGPGRPRKDREAAAAKT